MVYTKIIKHGHSAGVMIPAEWRRQLDIKVGDYLVLCVVNGGYIVLKKAEYPPVPTIDISKLRDD